MLTPFFHMHFHRKVGSVDHDKDDMLNAMAMMVSSSGYNISVWYLV